MEYQWYNSGRRDMFVVYEAVVSCDVMSKEHKASIRVLAYGTEHKAATCTFTKKRP
jgi:hypothetical protein